ncbi:MAG: hypothetical protein IKA93_01300 [Elusimicrobiaceae bacterium]|nr:hypothetical protein [Elusimicrobiaceae bacterium]
MTTLVILFLLGAVTVYAVFFLLFKVLWIILKKSSNKWPLILAGISTVLFGIAAVGTLAWGTYKIISPFRGMIERYDEKAPLTYGSTTYTDPRYGFSVDLYNGMDLSEWMNFDDVSVKVGADMNAFKKSPDNKQNEMVFAFIIRQTDIDTDEPPFQDLYEALDSAKQHRRQLDISEEKQITIDGKPGYYVSGRAYANNGTNGPFWMTAVYDNHQIIYVITVQLGNEEDTSVAQKMAESLHLVSAQPLQELSQQ